MNASMFLVEHKKTIDCFAWKVLRRVRAAGLRAVDYDDVKQELAIACIKAAQSWNSEVGVPFGPYLMNGMKMHINRWMDNQVYEDHNANVSLDHSYSDNGEGESTMLDYIPSSEQRADEALIDREKKALVMNRLSPRAQMFLNFLTNPPGELVDIFKAMRAKAAYAQKLGVSTFIPAQISESLVFDLMGASRSERTKLKHEVQAAACKVAKSLR